MTCSTGSSGQKHFRLLFKLHDDHGCVQMVHFWHRSCPKMDSILNFYIVKNGWKFQFASGKRTASIPRLAGAQHSTFKSGDRSKIFHLRRKGWGWRGVSSPPLFFINLSAYYTVTRNIYFNIQDSLTVLKVITEIKLLGTTIIAAYKMTTNHFKKKQKILAVATTRLLSHRQSLGSCVSKHWTNLNKRKWWEFYLWRVCYLLFCLYEPRQDHFNCCSDHYDPSFLRYGVFNKQKIW